MSADPPKVFDLKEVNKDVHPGLGPWVFYFPAALCFLVGPLFALLGLASPPAVSGAFQLFLDSFFIALFLLGFAFIYIGLNVWVPPPNSLEVSEDRAVLRSARRTQTLVWSSPNFYLRLIPPPSEGGAYRDASKVLSWCELTQEAGDFLVAQAKRRGMNITRIEGTRLKLGSIVIAPRKPAS